MEKSNPEQQELENSLNVSPDKNKDHRNKEVAIKKYWFRLGYDISIPVSKKYQFPKIFYPISIEGWLIKFILPILIGLFYIVFNRNHYVVLNIPIQGIILINIFFTFLVTCFFFYVYYKRTDRTLYDEALLEYKSESKEERRIRNKKINIYAIFIFTLILSIASLPFLIRPITAHKTAEKFIENIEDGNIYESYVFLSPHVKSQFGGNVGFTRWAKELQKLGLPENVELKEDPQSGTFSGFVETLNSGNIYFEIKVIKKDLLDFEITDILIKKDATK